MMLALEMFRSIPRTVAGKAMGSRMPGLLSGYAAPLRLVTIDPPKSDRPGWARIRTRLSGICGSDLGMLSGKTSLYFSAVVSLPFVPGHEVVGELLDDCEDLPAGTRVVLDPVLTCAARSVEPCENCAAGEHERLLPDHRRQPVARPPDRVLQGHRRRLGPAAVGAPQPDARRARGLLRRAGAARRAGRLRGAHRAARRRPGQRPGARQRRRLGGAVRDAGAARADAGRRDHRGRQARPPAGARPRARRHRGGRARARCCAGCGARRARSSSSPSTPRRTCSAASTSPSTRSAASSRWRPRLQATRAGGRVVMSGMPAPADLSAAWFRELEVVGTYASSGGTPFPQAMELVGHDTVARIAKSVASYPLHRWREALDHAHSAGGLGTVKVAFDPRSSHSESPRFRARGRRPDAAVGRPRRSRFPARGSSRSAPAWSTRRRRCPPSLTSTRRSARRC